MLDHWFPKPSGLPPCAYFGYATVPNDPPNIKSPHLKAGHYILGGLEYTPKGVSNRVYYSTNAKHWAPLKDAPWESRHGLQALYHRGGIFVIGGESTGEEGAPHYHNDVWRYDGQWTLLKTNAPFEGRSYFGLAHWQHTLYLMGGKFAKGGLNDLWCSKDGFFWEKQNAELWSERYNFAALTFDHRIVFSGGASNCHTQPDMNTIIIYPQSTSAVSQYHAITQQVTPPREGYRLAAFKHGLGGIKIGCLTIENELLLPGNTGLAMLGGTDDQAPIWLSPFGENWVHIPTKTWQPRHGFGIFTEGNTLHVVGGMGHPNADLYSNVLQSNNLTKWKTVAL